MSQFITTQGDIGEVIEMIPRLQPSKMYAQYFSIIRYLPQMYKIYSDGQDIIGDMGPQTSADIVTVRLMEKGSSNYKDL